MAVRLNKYLADRGVGARRKCDQLIEAGRVSVNGRVVSQVGTKVEEGRDRVAVDGRPVGGKERTVYYVLNKPVGVITTLDDPQGRRTIRDLLPPGARVYPVGRLDADTSGLLLLTNDGELAHKLMHPRYGVPKVYRVRLAAEPRPDQLRRLAAGVRYDPEHRDRVSAPARARRIQPGFDAIMIEVILHEGRFRQVRRMCEAVGLEVTGLHRVGYGPLALGPLARGMFRELSAEEVARLKATAARRGGGERVRPVAAGRGRRREPREGAWRGGAPAPEGARRGPAAARRSPEPPGADPDEGAEDTWVPGGGYLEPAGEESDTSPPRRGRTPRAWPARPGAGRGDADWQRSAGEREPSPRVRAPRPGGDRQERARPRRQPRGGRPRGERGTVAGAYDRGTPRGRPGRTRRPGAAGRGGRAGKAPFKPAKARNPSRRKRR